MIISIDVGPFRERGREWTKPISFEIDKVLWLKEVKQIGATLATIQDLFQEPLLGR